LYFGDNRLPRAMVRNGRAGWYYRVLEAGSLRAGDAITLSERPNPDFGFARLVSIVNYGHATMAELSQMADMPGLASQWRAHAREVLREGNA
jgi:MOSC domain-containing protein YiiM